MILTSGIFKEEGSIFSKLSLIFASIICFSLPLYQKIIPLLIILWIVCRLANGNLGKHFSTLISNKISVMLIVFYLLHIIGLVYTSNMKAGFFDLEVKLSLLAFPLFFPNSDRLYSSGYYILLWSFITGCIISSLICLGHSFYSLIVWDATFQYFTYVDLSIIMHPSYFSMYLCFGVASILHLVKEKKWTKVYLILASLIALFFTVMIYLLSSKAGLIVLFILIVINSIEVLRKKPTYLFAGLLIFIAVVFTISKNDRFAPLKNMITNAFQSKTDDQPKDDSPESSNERVIIWNSAFKIIKENWAIGVGTGDVKDELIKQYENVGFTYGKEKKLNTHNQILETFIGLGIPGILSLLFLIFLSVRNSIIAKNQLLLNFTIIVFLNFLFESVLNTQSGTIFFGLFYALVSNFTLFKKEIA